MNGDFIDFVDNIKYFFLNDILQRRILNTLTHHSELKIRQYHRANLNISSHISQVPTRL